MNDLDYMITAAGILADQSVNNGIDVSLARPGDPGSPVARLAGRHRRTGWRRTDHVATPAARPGDPYRGRHSRS
jgi:hypothetical protein